MIKLPEKEFPLAVFLTSFDSYNYYHSKKGIKSLFLINGQDKRNDKHIYSLYFNIDLPTAYFHFLLSQINTL